MRQAIEESVGPCDVLIAVIGRHWLISSDEEGKRRIDNPEDFLRIEISTALKRDIRVIPVLLECVSRSPSEKAVGSTLGNIDSLVNKHLAAFRNAEKTLAQAKALVQTYGKKYPELAGYLPAGAGEERGIHILQDASNESEGSHKFYIRIKVGEPRYEVVGAGQHDYQQVDAATWTQSLKEQLAISIAKIVFAREAAQAAK